MDASRLNEAQQTLEALLPEMKLDGLSIDGVKFDFYTESIDVTYEFNGQRARVRLTMERFKELEEGRTFAAKHLRETLRKVFKVQDDD